MSGICKWRGCKAPTVVGNRGRMTEFCAEHLPQMQAKWRSAEKKKRGNGDVKRDANPAEVIPGTDIPKPPIVPYTPVLVLKLCPRCGRAFWLKPGETPACDCQPATPQPSISEKLLALVNPADNTIGLYVGRLEHTGMTCWSDDDPRSGYAAVATRLAEGGYELATLVTPHPAAEG